MKRYDVVVVGGGFAGVCAAISAAREGSRVLLVEKGNALGGAAVNSLVIPFMPNATKLDGALTELSQGLFKTICEKLSEKGAMRGKLFLEEELKFILNDMVREVGVDLLYHAYIFAAKKDNGKIESVTVATKSGPVEIEGDYFVDCTGDAQLAYLSDCPYKLGRESDGLCQPMTLCFRLGNVDVDAFYKTKESMKQKYREAKERGELMNPREDVLLFRSPIPNVMHFNTTRVVKLDPTNPEDVTKAELFARDQIREIIDFMKKNGDGLDNCFLMETGAEIGVRESRMIVGDYVLTESDCRAFTKFSDSIAACNYDIDIHNPEGSGTSHYFFPEGEYYTIPYRCLIPKTVSNMLVAGRCISSDHGAQASYRIMPTVCTLGEAAGVAIGIAVKKGCDTRSIDVCELQAHLRENGAFLGI